MLNENFEFNFNESAIVFKENLSGQNSLIHQKAILRAQKYLVAEASLLEVIIEIDRNRIYEEFGLTHLTPYCIKHLGLSEDVAANFVRVARKSQQVPELKIAIDEGRLSVTKAKTIASVITVENQNIWIDKAQSLTKEKLEKEVAVQSPQAKKPEKAKVQGPDRIRIEFDLIEEEMKLFRRAQDLVSQKLKKSASLAETQFELLKVFLEKTDPVKKAERVNKRLDSAKSEILENSASKKTAPNKQDLSTKPSHPSRDRPDKKNQNKVARESLKAEVIHTINLRDNGQCQAVMPDGSICRQSRWVHFHHINPVSKGGENKVENLITLCSSHHRLWHEQAKKG